jgi:hypothetical protein
MASSRAAIFINWLKMQLSGGKDANKIAILILKHMVGIVQIVQMILKKAYM